ncbi:hypothetical protein [Fonticella tunisiensis]|uniref:Uncharacterized protein n=1 Tax=Fonticella tunisiensis TaxID=1096341 RepID=A0A4R7KS04_9CLOT|nr:hypothetical protein [Fonticella tunisiensis]TDT61545.1 hypothetical protein EDD71_10629 [Fonticella tunisiensis]
MKNYEAKLSELKDRLETSKNKKIKAETKLEQLQNQKNDIIKELKNMGVSPENLDDEIKKLESEIEKLIMEVDNMVPKDI